MDNVKIVRTRTGSFDIFVNDAKRAEALTRELTLFWLTKRRVPQRIASGRIDYAAEAGMETFKADLIKPVWEL